MPTGMPGEPASSACMRTWRSPGEPALSPNDAVTLCSTYPPGLGPVWNPCAATSGLCPRNRAPGPLSCARLLTNATRSNCRIAIGLSENLPVSRRLVMVWCGTVAPLLRENSLPSSVPASYGNSSTLPWCIHAPSAPSNGSPDTPTNQSGLGATIDASVTEACPPDTIISKPATGVPPETSGCRIISEASGPDATTSDRNSPVRPVSAMISVPSLATPPRSQKTTPLLCTAPISVVKCAPPGTPTPGASAPVVNAPVNVT